MTRIGRRYWRAYYRLNIRRGRKLRMLCTVEEYEEYGLYIRMLRNHHGLDWTASLCTWPDDLPRARRTHGWKDHKCRCQWEHRVRLQEKHDRVTRRKAR